MKSRRYFFIKTDETLEEYMNKLASRAFYCGMITTAVVALVCFCVDGQADNVALLYGFASGWGISVAVHSFSIGYYKFKESWGLEHDKEQINRLKLINILHSTIFLYPLNSLSSKHDNVSSHRYCKDICCLQFVWFLIAKYRILYQTVDSTNES